MKQFLKERILAIAFFIIVIILYLSIFLLYKLDLEPFLYGSLVICVLGLIGLAISYNNFRKKQKSLKRITDLEHFDIASLPDPYYASDRAYQEIIQKLNRYCSDLATAYQNDRQDYLDYYTTWVHQIKTPISVMRLMLQAEDTEENRNLLAELFRIEQYVEMVLSYIRLGSSTNDLLLKEYDLDEIIREAIRKYANQFIKNKLAIKYEATELKVVTDKKWLGFIIEQILSNAVKYTYSGFVSIIVNEDKKLIISDTGIGIAAEDLPRIFEKGYTGYNGRENNKSTGLGLYLCKSAAQKLGHGLSASSEVGKGSSFIIDLNTYEIKPE